MEARGQIDNPGITQNVCIPLGAHGADRAMIKRVLICRRQCMYVRDPWSTPSLQGAGHWGGLRRSYQRRRRAIQRRPRN